jgi:hypothetical protein
MMMQTLRNKIAESDHPVGVKRISNWKLPDKNFTYGWKEKGDPEGADISKQNKLNQIVTRSWKTHNPSKNVIPQQDFVKMNKLAVKKKNKSLVIIS